MPSGPFTSPSIAVICAKAAPAKNAKQKPPKMYPRNLASINFPPEELTSTFQHTTMGHIRALTFQQLYPVPGAEHPTIVPRGSSRATMRQNRGFIGMRAFTLLLLSGIGLFAQSEAPSNPQDYVAVGRDRFLSGDYKQASEAFERAFALDPSSAECALWLGRSY